MSTKHNHPAFPPQIALDQFQRPIAPIPGMSMLDYFALHIYCHKCESGQPFSEAVEFAKQCIDYLSEYQSQETLSTLKIIGNEQ